MSNGLIEIGSMKGTRSERQWLQAEAKRAQLTVSSFLRVRAGLAPLHRGTPKRRRLAKPGPKRTNGK